MRRAFRLVIGCFSTAVTLGGVSADLAVGTITALGVTRTASGAESPRGLHVISTGSIDADELVLASDGTPWFSDYDRVIHVTPDGRVLSFRLPASTQIGPAAWGTDGALWATDEAIRGLIRVAPDGSETRFRDVW